MINRIIVREYVSSVVVAGVVCFCLSVLGNDYIKSKVDFGFILKIATQNGLP